jgi:DNA-binding MarR family transcriptional regulator
MSELIRRVQRAYPQVFLACHVRHSTQLRDHGMSERDASVLAHLDELAPVTVTALAHHLGVGVPTVTEAIDRLERRGVVERRRDVRDRRRVELRLTRLGIERMQASSVLDHARVGEVLAALSARQRSAAVRGLEILAAGARKVMTDERSTGGASRRKR